MDDALAKMNTLKGEIPASFQAAEDGYLAQVEAKRPELETAFQTTLNEGFKNVYWTTAISAIIALVLLMFYRDQRKLKKIN